MIPVHAGAKNPRVFKTHFFIRWDPYSWGIIQRLSRAKLRGAWPNRIKGNFMALAQRRIVPSARNALKARYNFSGESARSIRMIGRKHTATKAEVEVGSTMLANDPPVFGQWAHSPFATVLGLHEGIKRHLVFIRYGGWERKGLVEWARAHGIAEPPRSKNWAITVYKRGRRRSAHKFFGKDMGAAQHKDDAEEAILRALAGVIGNQYIAPLGGAGAMRH